MDINNATEKFGAQYIKDCANANKLTDSGRFGNGDGKLQPKEMFGEAASLSKSIFSGNEQIFSKALELNSEQFEISQKFAGSDGVISAEEKAEMINSKEWVNSMEEYRSLYKEADCSKKYGTQYYNQGVEALKNMDKTVGNNDGKVSLQEYGTKIMNMYNSLFKKDTDKLEKSEQLAKLQVGIAAKFAGQDGNLSPAEYIEALNSDEYGKTLKDFRALMEQNQQTI